jgi:predicted GH43/DUF377 family glycosyl hydrolase
VSGEPREELFRRYDGNPILTAAQWPQTVNAVFNPAAVQFEGETLLLVRVEDRTGVSHLSVARSADGLPYERTGDVDQVVFPCGWLLLPDGDTLNMYYEQPTAQSAWRPQASQPSSPGSPATRAR